MSNKYKNDVCPICDCNVPVEYAYDYHCEDCGYKWEKIDNDLDGDELSEEEEVGDFSLFHPDETEEEYWDHEC